MPLASSDLEESRRWDIFVAGQPRAEAELLVAFLVLGLVIAVLRRIIGLVIALLRRIRGSALPAAIENSHVTPTMQREAVQALDAPLGS